MILLGATEKITLSNGKLVVDGLMILFGAYVERK